MLMAHQHRHCHNSLLMCIHVLLPPVACLFLFDSFSVFTASTLHDIHVMNISTVIAFHIHLY
jgi:hypothetical protein